MRTACWPTGAVRAGRVTCRRASGGEAVPFFASLRERVAQESRGYPAPLEIVTCLAAAAARPFDEGRQVEREGFLRLMDSPESRALRHLFLAERDAARFPGLPADTPSGASATSPSSAPARWAAASR